MISISKFQINSRNYYIAYQKEKIAPLDLFAQLSQSPIFPKVYFSHRDNNESRIANGKILACEKIPVIKLKEQVVGEKFDVRFYGGKAFEADPLKKHPFKSFKSEYFFIPEYEIVEKGGQFFLLSYFLSTKKFNSATFKKVKLTTKSYDEKLNFKVVDAKHYPDCKTWNKRIQTLIEDIKGKLLEKAVIARRSTITLDREIDPFLLLKKLPGKFAKSSFFCFQFKSGLAFLGASPECLYTRSQAELKTEALAGTCCKKDTKDLLSSHKEVKEFGYVTHFLTERLKELSSKLISKEDRVVDIGYLRHLYRPFLAKLNPSVSDSEIVKKLFPSPALCGTPQNKALDKIKQLEDFNRHWYAAPIGWISEHQAQLIIAIRSCLISNQTVNLFVGNGIVKDSDPEKEWEELNIKMRPFFSIFSHENK